MSTDAKLILKHAVRTERWEHQDRGDYNLDRFDREFRDRLYSDKGKEILRAQEKTDAQDSSSRSGS